MPRSRKRSRRPHAKRSKRRRVGRRAISRPDLHRTASRVPRLIAPQGTLPESALVTLNYWEQVQFVSTGTLGSFSPTSYIFRLTGLYDPNQTGVGHQPYYFDQWCTFYDRYRVLNTKWTATAYQKEGGAGSEKYFTAMMYSSNESVGALIQTVEALENKRINKKLMFDRDANGGRNPTVTLSGRCNNRQYHPSQNLSNLGSLCGSNPTTMVNLGLGFANATGTTAGIATTIVVMVRMQHKVLFTERKVVSAS